MKKLNLGIALCLAIFASSALASPLTVSSYATINGGTGAYNYRDFTYSNCAGACDTTSSSLSGGVGKLTDGISPSNSWSEYGYNTPWLGWYTGYAGNTNPTVTFNFGNTVNIDSVTVWVDNALGTGGVYLPASVSINGVNFAITPDNSNPAPRAYTFSGLGISDANVDIQFFQTNILGSYSPWIMVGEVSFDGSNSGNVPEPGSLALLGLGLTALVIRKRVK